MKDLKEFDISFIGLKDGLHQFDYSITKKFFDYFDFDEYNRTDVKVSISFLKKPTLFELNFQFSGFVELACDLTNEMFDQPIESALELVVKFGENFNNDNVDMLIIPHGEHKLNVAQYIYEAIVLAVPFKRIHPGVIDGSLKSSVLEKLKEFEIDNQEDKNNENDPVWDKLKNLK